MMVISKWSSSIHLIDPFPDAPLEKRSNKVLSEYCQVAVSVAVRPRDLKRYRVLPSAIKVTVISMVWPFSITVVRQVPSIAVAVRGVGEGVGNGDGLDHDSGLRSLFGSSGVAAVDADIRE